MSLEKTLLLASVGTNYKPVRCRFSIKIEQNLHLDFLSQNPQKFPIFNRHFLNAQCL